MKRWLNFFSLCIGIAIVSFGLNLKSKIQPGKISVFNTEKNHRPAKALRLAASFEQEFASTMDPALGDVPRNRLRTAYRILKDHEKQGSRNAIPGIKWNERGPINVAGRIRTLYVDPLDVSGETVWAAGVSGGLWKTTNISYGDPNWSSVDDFFENLAITSMAFSPVNPNLRYFCTGEGFDNIDAVKGLGIWKSFDGGDKWNWLTSTGSSTFEFCQKLVITPTGAVLVATKNAGVQRSADDGLTWNTVLDNSNGGASSDFAYDIEVLSNGDIVASLDGSVHNSTNDGVSFSSAKTIPTAASRIELAAAPSDSSVLYGILENGGIVAGMMKSTDGGNSWNAISEPSDITALVPSTDFSNGQAWYDLALAVDPNDPNTVFAGGINLFKSIDGGANWTQLTSWYNSSSLQIVHADQHAIVFQPGSSDVIYFANDGGIYVTKDGTANVPDLEKRNLGLNVTQVVSVAGNPTAGSDYFLFGAQDNGSQRLNEEGKSFAWEFMGGDGGFTFVDENEPQFQFASYIFNNYYRSIDGGKNWTQVNYGNSGWFVNPMDYDNNANILYAAHNTQQYLRWNDPQSGSSFTPITINQFGSGGKVTAVAVSSLTPGRVFFGLDNGRVVQVDNADAGSPSGVRINNGSGMPVGTVSCIAIEDGNDNHLLVTLSNYGVSSVWETIDGGVSWNEVEGNLPDMPVRWAIFNPDNANMALVATEIGVWSTSNLDGINTQWGPSGNGMANVKTTMLKLRQSDKVMMAAAYGRGVFTSGAFSMAKADFHTKDRVHYTASPIRFKNDSYGATSYFWDFGDGNTSTGKEPKHFYTSPGIYDVTLSINGGASVETRTGYVQILPDKGTPYMEVNGGNFETNVNDFGSQAIQGNVNLWEHGAPSGTLTTLNSAPFGWKTDLDSTIIKEQFKCALYSPSFNFTTVGSYDLSFRLSMHYFSCSGPFALQCQYSTDKGKTWTRLGIENDTNGTNWYNVGYNSGVCKIPSSIFEDNYAWIMWATNIPVSYDVSFLGGNPDVAFRFVFAVAQGFGGGYNADGAMIDDFKITGSANGTSQPIPVDMGALAGEWRDTDAFLSWETYSEKNSSQFEVERSIDGVWFEQAGSVVAAGESSELLKYSFLDTQLLENSYHFRLKIIDQDGQYSYSNSVHLERPGSQPAKLVAVHPVPFKESFGISFSSDLMKSARVRLLGADGKVYFQETLNPGTRKYFLDGFSDLACGVYFLVINRQGKQTIRKILKS